MEDQQILLFLGIALLFLLLMFRLHRNKKQKEAGFSFDYSYMPYTRRNLLTKAEHHFYTTLIEECRDRSLLVCPKVRLEDLVYVTDKENRAKYRGYVKSRHVDFVLTDDSLCPVAAIELDDPSHDSYLAMQIDEFKNRLFETIGLPLFRIRTDENYEEALEEIFNTL